MNNGVPLTEEQFRGAWAAMESELDQLPPPAARDEWQLQRGYDVIKRFSVLTGTFPQAFPMLGDVDTAWAWYAENNRYESEVTHEKPLKLRAVMNPRLMFGRRSTRHGVLDSGTARK